MDNKLRSNLNELSIGWHVDIVGRHGQWIVRLMHPETGGVFVYRDENLSRAVSRAWAGEPSDRKVWEWEE